MSEKDTYTLNEQIEYLQHMVGNVSKNDHDILGEAIISLMYLKRVTEDDPVITREEFSMCKIAGAYEAWPELGERDEE